MRTLLTCLTLALLALTGCAFLQSSTTSPDGSKTRVGCLTFFDSQSALAKFRNASTTTSNGQWSAGTTIGSLNQESSGTNVVALVGSAAELGKLFLQMQQPAAPK